MLAAMGLFILMAGISVVETVRPGIAVHSRVFYASYAIGSILLARLMWVRRRSR